MIGGGRYRAPARALLADARVRLEAFRALRVYLQTEHAAVRATLDRRVAVAMSKRSWREFAIGLAIGAGVALLFWLLPHHAA